MRRIFFYPLILLFSAALAAVCTATPAAAIVPTNSKIPAAESPASLKKQGAIFPKPRPVDKTAAAASENTALLAPDVDETIPLPAYQPNARTATGKMQAYTIDEEDTLQDVARHYKIGFVEMRAANPEVDSWAPVPGEKVVIPSFKLLPRAPQKGIVVNLAQMRMYYFSDPKKEPITFPIGIGREGLQTPTGETTVVRKTAGPAWFPTERMREEKPWLPPAVPTGPSNPLGTHALYLGWPTFLIHGSNKPGAIGRRVSSGCMRMYPEDISTLFNIVPVGTKVTVVEQPLLVAWVGDDLYLEANPSRAQGNEIEIDGDHEKNPFNDALKKVITDAASIPAERIDWNVVKTAVEERRGYPVIIASNKTVDDAEPRPTAEKPAPTENRYN